MRQSRSQLLLRHHGEAIDTRTDQKAFEPTHAGGCEGFNVIFIIVDHSAPCRPIHAAFAARGRTLRFKCRDRRGRRKAVQRHIDQQRVSACRRGSCRGFESFPLRTAGIVDVHVRIDKSRKNHRFAEIMNFVAFDRYLIGKSDTLDPLSIHKYGRRANSLGSDHTASNEGLQSQQ